MGHELTRRILSALVLAPVALFLLYIGGPAFAALVAVAALVMIAELYRLTRISNLVLKTVTASAAIATVIALVYQGQIELGGVIFLAGALLLLPGGEAGREVLWRLAGYLYIGVPCIALIWLRTLEPGGFATVLWLLLVVWAMDVGAYVAGKSLGGPKLWERVSPNKTWSGLAGGVLLAVATGAITAAFLDARELLPIAFLAAAVGLWSQAGDFLESALKRRFDVKDSGSLLPGHGGLLDRLDSTLFGALAVAAFVLLQEGPVTPWS